MEFQNIMPEPVPEPVEIENLKNQMIRLMENTQALEQRIRVLEQNAQETQDELQHWLGAHGIIGWIVPYIRSLMNILGFIPQVEEVEAADGNV